MFAPLRYHVYYLVNVMLAFEQCCRRDTFRSYQNSTCLNRCRPTGMPNAPFKHWSTSFKIMFSWRSTTHVFAQYVWSTWSRVRTSFHSNCVSWKSVPGVFNVRNFSFFNRKKIYRKKVPKNMGIPRCIHDLWIQVCLYTYFWVIISWMWFSPKIN